jgi:DNA-binding MarR family transcriptional regulator
MKNTEGRAAPRLGTTLRFMGALWDVNHQLEVISMKLHRSNGVTARQRFVIRIAGKLGPLPAGELARALHVHPGTLSVALSRLEQRGLIARKRDAKDARVVMISLTAHGRRLDATLPRFVERAVARTLKSGRAADAKLFYRSFVQLADELRKNAAPE